MREGLRALSYRRLHILLQRESGSLHPINHKRVQRLYRLVGLAIRRRPRKRMVCVPRGTPLQTWLRGETWANGFMQDVLADERRFRTLNVLDIVTRECLAINVDTSFHANG